MDTIKKTYKLTSDKQRIFFFRRNNGRTEDVEFRQRTIYDITGTYSTRDKAIQTFLESRKSFGRDFILVEEVDVADSIRPQDYEAPVFEKPNDDAMEFPNFNAAKKYAVDTHGADPKTVRTMDLLAAFLDGKGVKFTISK